MTNFYTKIDGNQWNGFEYIVDYKCQNCKTIIERAQIQWEDKEVHQKFTFCPFCGAPIPKNFPLYTNKGWIYIND